MARTTDVKRKALFNFFVCLFKRRIRRRRKTFHLLSNRLFIFFFNAGLLIASLKENWVRMSFGISMDKLKLSLTSQHNQPVLVHLGFFFFRMATFYWKLQYLRVCIVSKATTLLLFHGWPNARNDPDSTNIDSHCFYWRLSSFLLVVPLLRVTHFLRLTFGSREIKPEHFE